MKITKSKVRTSCICDSRCVDHKKEAEDYIRAAMEHLALACDDDICEECIANLSVILVELNPECPDNWVEVPEPVEITVEEPVEILEFEPIEDVEAFDNNPQ